MPAKPPAPCEVCGQLCGGDDPMIAGWAVLTVLGRVCSGCYTSFRTPSDATAGDRRAFRDGAGRHGYRL